ncbi:MAG: hypothetical protein EHM13_12070, partial [Acidobacteria bacterium]
MSFSNDRVETAFDTGDGRMGSTPGGAPKAVASTRLRGLALAVRALHDSKGLQAVADQAIVSATNFLTGVVIGRACSKEEFGLYMLAFVVITLAAEVQTSLISTPYTIYRPRLDHREVPRYTAATLVLQLLFAAVSMGALLAGSRFLAASAGPPGLAPVLTAL